MDVKNIRPHTKKWGLGQTKANSRPTIGSSQPLGGEQEWGRHLAGPAYMAAPTPTCSNWIRVGREGKVLVRWEAGCLWCTWAVKPGWTREVKRAGAEKEKKEAGEAFALDSSPVATAPHRKHLPWLTFSNKQIQTKERLYVEGFTATLFMFPPNLESS